jgi:hypothetical protein
MEGLLTLLLSDKLNLSVTGETGKKRSPKAGKQRDPSETERKARRARRRRKGKPIKTH